MNLTQNTYQKYQMINHKIRSSDKSQLRIHDLRIIQIMFVANFISHMLRDKSKKYFLQKIIEFCKTDYLLLR